MYPKLFNADATSWASFGIGVLSGAISCDVEENRNGSYELEMTYPVIAPFYDELKLRRLIVAKPNYTDVPQPFRIYDISKPLNGVVTVKAQHISYDLSGYIDAPFEETGITAALQRMVNSNTVYPTSCPFTFSTDLTGSQTMKVKHPQSVRALMGGVEGSLIDLYGGEWHFNGYACELKAHRGEDRGVLIRYGKNLTDLRQEENNASVYTGVYPYYYNADADTLVTLTEKVISVSGTFDYSRILPLDLTSEFEEAPTQEALRTRANSYITTNQIGVPKVNLTISFVEADSIAERVDLCDTVSVRFDAMGVSTSAKCIRTKWDVLKERYIEAELGSVRKSLTESIAQSADIAKAIEERSSLFKSIAQNVASKVTGNSGGYIVLHDTDNDGNPDEILILDNEDISQAVNVIRMNNGGIAFSKTGYTGTYTTAWNINGQFVADFIASGELHTQSVKILADSLFYWDKDNITIVDPTNQNRIIRFGKYDGTNYGLGFSSDGGSTWTTGLTFTGIKFLGSSGSSGRAEMGSDYFSIIRSDGVGITYLGAGQVVDIVDGAIVDVDGHYYRLGTGKAIYDAQNNKIRSYGNHSFCAGRANAPRGIYSVAAGYNNESWDDSDISIGRSNLSKTEAAIAIGKSNSSLATSAITLGKNNRASANRTVAIGSDNTVSDYDSVVMGSENTVTGNQSVAIGDSNSIQSISSIAIGRSHSLPCFDTTRNAENICIGYDNGSPFAFSTLIGSHLAAGKDFQIILGRYNANSSTHCLIIGAGSGPRHLNNIMTMDPSGNMTISGTLTQNSDRRLKTVVDGLPDVSGIRAVRFRWNDKKMNGDQLDHLGYIAQDVEAVAPYLVSDDSNGYKALDYIGLMVAKIEQLERKVEELTHTVEALRNGNMG